MALFDDNESLFEKIVYDETLIDQSKLSFQEIAVQKEPIKILVAELNELKIYRTYLTIDDYENDNYSIFITSPSGINFQIDHQIYLRYDLNNQLIGFDLEVIDLGKVSLQFYSYHIIKKLILDKINPQDMQAIINVNRVNLYITPHKQEIKDKYLVYSNKVILLDEYEYSNGGRWYKVMFNSKSGPIITWVEDYKIKFI